MKKLFAALILVFLFVKPALAEDCTAGWNPDTGLCINDNGNDNGRDWLAYCGSGLIDLMSAQCQFYFHGPRDPDAGRTEPDPNEPSFACKLFPRAQACITDPKVAVVLLDRGACFPNNTDPDRVCCPVANDNGCTLGADGLKGSQVLYSISTFGRGWPVTFANAMMAATTLLRQSPNTLGFMRDTASTAMGRAALAIDQLSRYALANGQRAADALAYGIRKASDPQFQQLLHMIDADERGWHTPAIIETWMQSIR